MSVPANHIPAGLDASLITPPDSPVQIGDASTPFPLHALAYPMVLCRACDREVSAEVVYPVLGIGECCDPCIEVMREADA